jgi:hypothetical protein
VDLQLFSPLYSQCFFDANTGVAIVRVVAVSAVNIPIARIANNPRFVLFIVSYREVLPNKFECTTRKLFITFIVIMDRHMGERQDIIHLCE